jgi:hypothetical protein
MKKLILVLAIIFIFALPALAGQRYYVPSIPMPQRMLQQSCSDNFYDANSKNYLNKSDCEDEIYFMHRVFIIYDNPFQPSNLSPGQNLYMNYGWGNMRQGR